MLFGNFVIGMFICACPEWAGEYSRYWNLNFRACSAHSGHVNNCQFSYNFLPWIFVSRKSVNAGCRVFVGELNRGVCGTGPPPNNLHEGACPLNKLS